MSIAGIAFLVAGVAIITIINDAGGHRPERGASHAEV